MKILVTGGLGFIGSNFIRYELACYDDIEVWNLDKLTYAANPMNLENLAGHKRYHFIRGDISDAEIVEKVFKEGFDAVVNFAAESHVDRSIVDAEPFMKTNLVGVQVLLDAVKKYGGRFVQISTDEVYGSIPQGKKADENYPYQPSSPYAASKAGADLICRSYLITHNVDVVITRSSNNYGPYQFPEKLIPLMIAKAMRDEPLPVYGDGMNVRDWLYVEDNCRAIDLVMRHGKSGHIYNIAADNEKTNLEVVRMILHILQKPEDLITFVKDRPGHDRRYALDSSKIRNELGWQPLTEFEDGLRKTVDWYRLNQRWLKAIYDGTYQASKHLCS